MFLRDRQAPPSYPQTPMTSVSTMVACWWLSVPRTPCGSYNIFDRWIGKNSSGGWLLNRTNKGKATTAFPSLAPTTEGTTTITHHLRNYGFQQKATLEQWTIRGRQNNNQHTTPATTSNKHQSTQGHPLFPHEHNCWGSFMERNTKHFLSSIYMTTKQTINTILCSHHTVTKYRNRWRKE